MPTSSRQDAFEGGIGDGAVASIATCAVVPQRTSDSLRARALFARDGAVIWTGGSGTEFDDAAATPSDVFGSVRSRLPPVKICYGNGAVGDADVRRDGGAHTDGYAYGVRACRRSVFLTRMQLTPPLLLTRPACGRTASTTHLCCCVSDRAQAAVARTSWSTLLQLQRR
jgi:hypothetical protein